MKQLSKLALMFAVSGFMASNAHGIVGDFRELSFSQSAKSSLEESKIEQDEAYYEVASVEVEEIKAELKENKPFKGPFNKSLGSVIMTVDKLIAIGKRVWTIIESGRPVAETGMANALHVLPEVGGARVAFYQMENWSAPKSKAYRVTYKNGFGKKVISFVYTVSFQYAGNFEGKGNYLTGVTVEASKVYVAWGFKFNASSEVVAITNKGSKEDPVASATIKVAYSASSVMKDIQTSESFHVDGLGNISKLH